MMKRFFWGVLALCLGSPLWCQTPTALSGSLDWDRMELNAQISLNLDALGITMPAGRTQAEEIIDREYYKLIRPHILEIPIDSATTLEGLIREGVFTLQAPEIIAGRARQIPPYFSEDLKSLSASYSVNLLDLGAQALSHAQPMEITRPLIPIPASSYTGIIILADETQPIRGRNTKTLPQPCLFPKIWDTEMNLIYEPNHLEPQRGTPVRYVSREKVFHSAPSGISPDLIDLLGENPLRIIARGVFGALPTDPIIDREDALLILSNEANRRLLREGRVVIVLDPASLKIPLKAIP